MSAEMANDLSSSSSDNNKIGIFIAALAAVLALITMAEDDAQRNAQTALLEASNQFAFFQAKNIRETDSKIAAQTLEALGKPDLAKEWKEKADRYEREQEGILNTAKAEQAKRVVLESQGENFGFANALLQIAIVLASASLILGGRFLLFGSMGLSFVAVLFAVNGYTLWVNIL